MEDAVEALLKEYPAAGEDEIAWKVVREISVRAAVVLKPVFDAQGGKNGRLSIQTDPRLYRDAKSIVEQAVEFSRLAPEHDCEDSGDGSGDSERLKRRLIAGSASMRRCALLCRSAWRWRKRWSAG